MRDDWRKQQEESGQKSTIDPVVDQSLEHCFLWIEYKAGAVVPIDGASIPRLKAKQPPACADG
jgi:hypothetical protein